MANLGSTEVALRAVAAFVQAFMTSMPSGKQNTFANTTLPDAVVVSLREDRPVSWMNAFEVPVPGDADGGRRVEAARRLAQEALALDEMYDTAARKTWVLASATLGGALDELGPVVNRTQLLEEMGAELGEVLA